VIDRHLRHPRAGQPEQGGQEAVHAVERWNAVQAVGAVGAQGTADVGDRVASNPVADAVRDVGRRPSQPAILPADTDAADDIVGIERGEQPGDVRRIVLQVGVERDHSRAAGMAEAGRERRRLAAVAAQPDHPRVRVRYRERLEDLRAAIRAAVVDEEGFVNYRRHGRADLGRQDREAPGFVEQRNDQRDLRLTSAHGGYLSRLR